MAVLLLEAAFLSIGVIAALYGAITGKLPRLLGSNITWTDDEGNEMDLPGLSEKIDEAHRDLSLKVDRVDATVGALKDRQVTFDHRQDAVAASLLDISTVINHDIAENEPVHIAQMREEFYPDRYQPGAFTRDEREDDNPRSYGE